VARLFTVFSHRLTESQVRDAREELACDEVVPMPADLAKRWASVPPGNGSVRSMAGEFIAWLTSASREGDVILVEGDYGMTFTVASWALDHGRVAVYSATERDCREETGPDGAVVSTRRFEHRGYRKYERWEK